MSLMFLNEAQRAILAQSWETRSHEQHWHYCLEEMGELLHALLRYNRRVRADLPLTTKVVENLKEELADVVVWLEFFLNMYYGIVGPSDYSDDPLDPYPAMSKALSDRLIGDLLEHMTGFSDAKPQSLNWIRVAACYRTVVQVINTMDIRDEILARIDYKVTHKVAKHINKP